MTMLLLLISIFLISLWIFLSSRQGNTSLPLPPGPKPLPLLGNIHQHPASAPWIKHQEWHQQYGSIISVKLGLRTIISLGTHKVLRDLVQKRSKIYSSRPRMRFLESVFNNNISFLMPYGSKWQETHRLLVSVLNPQSSNTYRRVQDIESTRLLFEALSGNQLSVCFRRFSLRVSSTLVYGHTLEDTDVDNQISEMSQIVDQIFLLLSPANTLVDLFPVLDRVVRYLPGIHGKKERQLRDRMAQIWSSKVNAAIRETTCSFTQTLHSMKPLDMTEEQFRYLIQELDLAINFTTPTLLDVIINVIVLKPSSVQRVQDELVSVVGSDRLPSFEDYTKLPYLVAFMNEVYRWKQIAPFAVPRAVTEDTEYMGYRIPKDAVILENQWSICNDQNVYVEPATFRPERWLENPDLPKAPLFGAGKRACPGEPLARNSIFIIVARLLWAFNVLPASEDVVEIDRSHDTNFLAFRLGCPNVTLQIRSPQHQIIIERGYANIRESESRG